MIALVSQTVLPPPQIQNITDRRRGSRKCSKVRKRPMLKSHTSLVPLKNTNIDRAKYFSRQKKHTQNKKSSVVTPFDAFFTGYKYDKCICFTI